MASAEKKKKYMQKFKNEWLHMECFKPWLSTSNKGDTFAYCKWCRCDISVANSGKTELDRHKTTKKHTDSTNSFSSQRTLHEVFAASSSTTPLATKIKEAEIHMVSYVIEHNLPFTSVEHLPKLIATICPDSEVVKNISLRRTKATYIAKNVLGRYSKEMLVNNLKRQKFSVMIDESTDKGVIKHLCLVVRLMIDHEVCDYFYDMIPIEGASAIEIYNAVAKSFDKEGIPWKTNLIGFASDGANNLMGTNHSVSTLLKGEIPNIFIMKCICHSFALCASYACAKLPQMAEDLVREVYNYVHCSPKRIGELKIFQTFLQIKPHKLLHPSQTRWLSLHAAVTRILVQYEALKLFFIDAVSNEGSSASARNILTNLNNPYIKIYLLFLDFILPHFNNLNKLMQSENLQIHNLRKKLIGLLKTILEFYMKPSYLSATEIESVNYKNPNNFLELEDIYMGAKVGALINQYPQNDVKALKLKILNFYIEGVSQIYKRFSFSNPVLKQIEVLDPKIIKERKYNSLASLVMHFPNLLEEDKWQELDDQWRLLRNSPINLDETNIPKFWREVGKEKIGDEYAFATLTHFMSCLMVLPHSSAAVERVFSAINLNKTKQRNSLSTKTLCGIMHSKRLYNKSACFSHEINRTMLSFFNKNMYEDDKDDDDDREMEMQALN